MYHGTSVSSVKILFPVQVNGMSISSVKSSGTDEWKILFLVQMNVIFRIDFITKLGVQAKWLKDIQ